MAMQPFTAEIIDSAAEDLAFAAQKLRDVAKQMREKQFPEVILQAETAFSIYCAKLVKLATEAESEFRDQYRAKQMGTVPRWKINQKVVEARRAAKAERKEKGIEAPVKKRKSD